ncbi:CidA/LrgA family protein|uniref:Holin-like protein n=1 Tax=Dendrosporobacter quercicolus TaxID=146817 RepID=A0A1G9TZQ5_9FIRM|nr:CidA/LrgA family protein [Dendrosporobacter quercicolus]NSL48812.1 CidA/LrgA family protein [Dendrosporobacter quercicolus DSM 1736]SDM52755.1 holin-like protein [Dendrosporobacter quercicolus]
MQFFGQLLLLCLVYWTGSQIVLWLRLPVPGTVAGMLLLFVLLSAGIIKLQHIQLATDFLLKHMLFFFIPIAVGLMNWGGLFRSNGFILAAAIIAGAAVPFFVIGRLGQKMAGRKSRCTS